MTGLELQNLPKSQEIKVDIKKIEIEKLDLTIVLNNDDTIKVKCTSKYELINVLECWITYITSFYIDGKIIALSPEIYWELYKGSNKNFAMSQMDINYNGNWYKLAERSYYFPQGKQGVYGIYYENELIYIGSSSNYIERWREHNINFRQKKVDVSKMYGMDYDADLLEYKILAESKEFEKIPRVKTVDMWIMENVEKFLIEKYQPKFNIEGIEKQFEFKATNMNSLKEEQVQKWLRENYNK